MLDIVEDNFSSMNTDNSNDSNGECDGNAVPKDLNSVVKGLI